MGCRPLFYDISSFHFHATIMGMRSWPKVVLHSREFKEVLQQLHSLIITNKQITFFPSSERNRKRMTEKQKEKESYLYDKISKTILSKPKLLSN